MSTIQINNKLIGTQVEMGQNKKVEKQKDHADGEKKSWKRNSYLWEKVKYNFGGASARRADYVLYRSRNLISMGAWKGVQWPPIQVGAQSKAI